MNVTNYLQTKMIEVVTAATGQSATDSMRSRGWAVTGGY